MGINSQGVAYNFGQLGSALLTHENNTLTAPEGQVIVAITFLGDANTGNLLSALVAEDNTKYINHDASAHSTGTYTRTVDGSTSSSQTVVFAEENTISGNNIIAVGDEVYLAVGTSLGTVSAVDVGGNTKTITFSGSAQSLSGSEVITFVKPKLAGYRGVGGMTLAATDAFPGGTTIYGRWDSVSVEDADTSLIAYFGE